MERDERLFFVSHQGLKGQDIALFKRLTQCDQLRSMLNRNNHCIWQSVGERIERMAETQRVRLREDVVSGGLGDS